MRRLLLLRHAKSSWSDPAIMDFDRPLNARGREAAPAIGALMAREGLTPDLILCSPALRARQTLALLAPHVRADTPTRAIPAIYEAPAAAVLEAVRAAEAGARTLLVVGHNPGLEDAAAILADPVGSDLGALARLNDKFPTAGLAAFTLDVGAWADIAPGRARLGLFARPRDIAPE